MIGFDLKGIQRNGFLEKFFGFGESFLLEEHLAQLGVGIRMLRIVTDGCPEILLGLLVASQPCVDLSEPVIGFGVGGVEAHGLPKLRNRSIILALPLVNQPQTIVRVRVIRLEMERLGQGFDRPGIEVLVDIGFGKFSIEIDAAGSQPDSLLIDLSSGSGPVLAHVHISQSDVGLEVIRSDLHYLFA